jgi:hypothetical protein
MIDLKNYAKILAEAGYSVMPCQGESAKGSKQKAPRFYELDTHLYPCATDKDRFKWERLQKAPLIAEDVDRYFRETDWLGIICGDKSMNLECLDFDNKLGNVEDVWREYIKTKEVEEIVLKHKLYIEKTVSGGRHLVYRCEDPIPAKQDIAFQKDSNGKPICIIETRSEGQYFVVAPSSGYERTYGSLTEMTPISSKERDVLIDFACSYNEYVKEEQIHKPTSVSGRRVPTTVELNDLRPGERYNLDPQSIQDAEDILVSEGWKKVSTYGWCRPGKTDGGISATFNKVFPGGLYIFSSNAYPFEEKKTYTPWSIMTLIYFNGDFKESAKVLAAKGYGNDNYHSKGADPAVSNYKAASKICFEILKRLKQEEDYTEADVAMVASAGGMTTEKAQSLLKSILDNNHFLRGHDSLSHEYKKVKAWLNHRYIFKKNIIKNEDVIIRRSDKSRVPARITTDTVYIECKEAHYKISKTDMEAIFNTDFVPEYNELIDYFEKLPGWKESDPDYIAEFASYFKCHDPKMQDFWVEMLRKHLIRHIKCAVAGIENRICLVLIGNQERGKSSYLRYLEPVENYYIDSDPVRIQHKDAQIAQCEYLIWNIEEIGGYNAAQLAQIKSMLSKPHDKIRGPYEKKAQNRLRICSFWATTNRTDFLVDDTGNTRFLCFKGDVTSYDYGNYETGLSLVPREKIWSQAYSLYKSKYEANLTAEERGVRDEVNKEYEADNNVESLIMMHFTPGDAHFWPNAKIQTFLQAQAPRMNDLTPNKISAAFDKLNKMFAGQNEDQFVRGKSGNQRGMYLCATSSEAAGNNPTTYKPEALPF